MNEDTPRGSLARREALLGRLTDLGIGVPSRVTPPLDPRLISLSLNDVEILLNLAEEAFAPDPGTDPLA